MDIIDWFCKVILEKKDNLDLLKLYVILIIFLIEML